MMDVGEQGSVGAVDALQILASHIETPQRLTKNTVASVVGPATA